MKLFTALVLSTNADVYLHMPRGSNNRLNERSTARDNANRLFDSQNNNNGGYNVADRGDEKAEKMSEQHSEMYFQSGTTGSSFMNIEWFNQHGCGKRDGDDANAIDCHMVIQYKCENVANSHLRNGMSTKTPQFSDDDDESVDERKRKDMKNNSEQGEERGKHGRTMTPVRRANAITVFFLPIKTCVARARFTRDKMRMAIGGATSVPRSVTTTPTGIRASGQMWPC